ncbi:hypothetical protein C5167_021458 [Papaver somniferum]|uniref:uncharacterized protein LOC113345966 isoform X1 n=1 Tax=Papaver somniferum TaxID=3469 RepID=UPI000E6F499D|nr:uncharacterized protein LOC113345966 isoform X1 [Papaver somniferum]RZC94213.1 hypothetical protein C5167_021458 [Papaver somniferum]
MDSNSKEVSQTTTSTSQSEKKKKSLCYHIVVLVIGCIFFTFLFSLLSFFIIFTAGFVSIFIDNFSIPTTSSLSTQCKIVSTGVDLRSSKVCELGLLNYKAKYVFDPLDKTRFRCRYDYYWATIFKIEYREHSSGEIRSVLVEAPKEALPLDCRPSFGTAWLTKDKFKVNETYSCKYTPGVSDVDIFPDNLFHCQAKDPSTFDMIRSYSSLSMKIIGFWFTSKWSTKRAIQSAVSGIFTGMATSMTVLILVTVLQRSKSRVVKILDARNLHLSVYGVYLKRVCFLVVYFWCMGWLTIQYSKMLGLPDLFGSS